MNKRALLITAIVHIILFAVIAFYGSRQGVFGEKMKSLTATLIPKEKIVEQPKPKVEEKRVEVPTPTQAPKMVDTPTPKPTIETPPPVIAAAPPVTELPNITFDDGAKSVITTTDPKLIYKSYVEHELLSKWNRPDNLDLVTDVRLTIDKTGRIVDTTMVKESGNPTWDNSVKVIFSKVKGFDREPPKEFPDKFVVRFDTAYE